MLKTLALVIAALTALLLGPPPEAPPPLPGPLDQAVLIDQAGTSPYVFTPEGQLPGQPEWERGYRQGLDRAKEVGYGWFYFSLQMHSLQLPDGRYDFAGLDRVVEYARSRGVRLVIDLQSCDFSLPQSPTLTDGYRVNSLHLNSPTCAPRDFAAVVDPWAAVAARYAPGGGLAQARGWTDDYSVDHYEIENEPNALPWYGNYEAVPKDYALYLSKVAPAIKAANPRAKILAPALSQSPEALDWLDRMLSTDPADMEWASDEYRADVAAGAPIVGGGPFIDFYSYHEDFADWSTTILTDRPNEVRAVIARHTGDPNYPSSANPVLWFTEGSAGITSGSDRAAQLKWSWANIHFTFQTLSAGGIAHIAEDFSTNNMDASATFAAQPGFAMAKALLAYFPSANGITQTTAATSAAAGQRVDSYTWTNPVTGLRSIAMWAQDFPKAGGSAPVVGSPLGQPAGPDFTVAVPVSTATAIVIDRDWNSTTVPAVGGTVNVTLRRDDPSPTVMVIER